MILDFPYSANDQKVMSDLPGDTEVSSDVSIIVEEILADAKCGAAANLGRSAYQHIHNFKVETSPINERAKQIYKAIADKVTTKKAPVTPPAAGDNTLEKAFSPETRRKANLREFLKGRLAEGDSAEAVIAHAARYDAATANLLREIAGEFA